MASVPVPGSPTGRAAAGDPRPGPSSAPPAPGRPPQSSEEQAGRGPPARFSIRPASSRSAGAVSGMRRPSLLELRSIFEGDPEAGGPRSPPRESRRRENSESGGGGGETRGASRTGPSSGGALPPRVAPKPPVETVAAQKRNKSTGIVPSCTPGTADPGVDRPGWKQDFHDRSKSLDWRGSSRAGPGFEKEANGPVRTAAPEERKPGATQWGSSPPRPPWNQDRGGGSDQAGADAYVSSAGRAERKSGGAAPGPLWGGGSVGKGARKILIVAERTRSGKSLPARIRPEPAPAEPGFCTAWARRDDPGPRRPSPTFAEAVARGSMAETPRRGSPVHARGPSPAQNRGAAGAVQDKDASPNAGRTSGNYPGEAGGVSERLQPGSADQAAARDQEPSRGASLRDPGNIPAGAGRPGPGRSLPTTTARSSSGSSCSSSSSSSSSRDSVFGSGVPSRLLERTHRGGPYPARVRPVTHSPSWERGPVSGAMTSAPSLRRDSGRDGEGAARTVTGVQRTPNSGVLSQQRELPRKPWDESRYRSHASTSDPGRQLSIQERPPALQPSQSRSGGGGGGSRPDFRDTAVSTETVRNKIHRFETLAHRKDSPAPKPDQRPGPSSSFQRAARVFSETAPGADPQRRGRPAWRRGDEERAAAWVRSASLDSAPRLGNPPADPDREEEAGGGDPQVARPPAGSDVRTGTGDECDSPAPKPTVPDSGTAAAPQEDTSKPGSPLVVGLGPITGNFNNNSSNGLPPSPIARTGLAPASRPAGHLPDLVPSGLLREPHPGKTPSPWTSSPGLPRPQEQTGESLRPPPAAPESRDTWGRWSSEEEDSHSESSDGDGDGEDTDSDRSDSGSSSLTITSSFSQSDRRSFSVSLADLCGLGGADDWDDSDAEDSRSLRSASLSSSMSSALSMVSIIPHDELESLLDDVRAAGEETLANCEDIQVVVLHKEAGSGLGFTVAGGVDQNKPVTVHRVFPCGLAAQEGSIREGDRVLSINGTALQAAAHWEALRTLRRARSREQAIVVLQKGTCTPAATAEPQGNEHRAAGTQPHSLPLSDAQPGKTVRLILTKSSSDLGFSLEGGRGSNQGDRPLTVKKVFPGGPVDQVLPGDEVLEVKGRSLRGLRRLEAWNWIKMLPPGPVEVLLQRPCRL